MKASLVATVAVSLAFAACSSTKSASPGDTTPPPGDGVDASADAATGPLEPPAAGTGIQYEMQTTIPAGVEDERCKFVVAPAEGMWVTNETVRYTPGSHHFILWATSYKSVPTTDTSGKPLNPTSDGIFECTNGPQAGLSTTSIVGGSQAATSPPILQNLPPGIGIHIEPGAVLMMNLHILNATGAAVDTDTRINLYTSPASSIKTEAGTFFFYNPFIEVPPHAAAHARMSCPVTSDVTILNAQTHMHARGIGGEASVAVTATDAITQPNIYTSQSWENVPVKTFAPGLALKAGQSIDYQCNYQSEQDGTVYQGLLTTDEMCVFTGIYYPRDTKFETCSTTGNFSDLSTGATYIGTGTGTCSTALGCVATASSLQDITTCIVDSCPSAGVPLTAILDCEESAQSGACASECSSASTCITCIEKTCASQISACEAAKCN
jgi:hypothetical protein